MRALDNLVTERVGLAGGGGGIIYFTVGGEGVHSARELGLKLFDDDWLGFGDGDSIGVPTTGGVGVLSDIIGGVVNGGVTNNEFDV